MTEWISVKDRLPKPEEFVNVTIPGSLKALCGFLRAPKEESNKSYRGQHRRAWWIARDFVTDDVTHWMPLPEPPKGFRCPNCYLVIRPTYPPATSEPECVVKELRERAEKFSELERQARNDGMNSAMDSAAGSKRAYFSAANLVRDIVTDDVTHWMPLPEPPKESQ